LPLREKEQPKGVFHFRDVPGGLLTFFRAFLNAVISSFSRKSRPSLLVSNVHLVHPARSECVRIGFAPAVFERDNVPVAILAEFHAVIFHCLMTPSFQDERR
jgi:hypothetical protein